MGINDLAFIKAARGESISHRDKIKAVGQGILGLIGYATIGCIIDDEADARYIHGQYVNDTTKWSSIDFKNKVIDCQDASLVYITKTNQGPNNLGDLMMDRLVQDLSKSIMNFYHIKLEDYSEAEANKFFESIEHAYPNNQVRVPSFILIKNSQMRPINSLLSQRQFALGEYESRFLPAVQKWYAGR